MDPASHCNEDEFGLWREILQDDELARQLADADTDRAIVLLLRNHLKIVALKLWRHRTGDALESAIEAVNAIARREGIEFA